MTFITRYHKYDAPDFDYLDSLGYEKIINEAQQDLYTIHANSQFSTLHSSLDCRSDSDISPMMPLCIGMDYNANINWIVCGQPKGNRLKKAAMINIQYTPPQYIFTSSLPTSISITTDASALDITVECGGSAVFTTTLYPYNREVILYDIRSIIEGYLLSNRLIYTTFLIFAESEDESVNTPEREAIYCRVDIPNNAASYYIQSFFFNTLSAYTIPFDAFQTLTLFALPGSTIPGYIECAVLPEGSTTPVLVRTAEDTITTKSSLDYFAIDIFPSRIQQSLKVSGKLLSFTVHYGHLAKTFYVSYGKPYLTFLAMNEFGCPEYIHLTCVTKRKLDISRSTATCLGASTFYDDNTAYEYEVESSMLTLEQTDHLSVLLLSQEISIITANQSHPIIITDITSEISDADNATNALKFKYKYARRRIPKSLHYPQNIFDDPFHRTFD